MIKQQHFDKQERLPVSNRFCADINKKLQQKQTNYRETSKFILVDQSEYNHFEKSRKDKNCDKGLSGTGFCKRVRSFTTRLIQRRKNERSRSKNIQRCQTWSSHDNRNSSFAQQLVVLIFVL